MKLLFICSGNTCRSPMAEGILRSFALPEVACESAGLSVLSRDCAHPDAVAVCAAHGIDISRHLSKPVTYDMAEDADLIVCMTDSHKAALISAGIRDDKLIALDIPDPYCRWLEIYEECFDTIKNELKHLLFEQGIFKLREFCKGDEKHIAALENECFSEPWSESSILSAENTGTRFFVCEFSGVVLGYGGVKTVADEAYVTNIAVTEKHRGLGIGRMLVKSLCDAAKEDGAGFISLEVRASNSAAISLYEAEGFKECGRRKNFYSKPAEDALIMTKHFEGK